MRGFRRAAQADVSLSIAKYPILDDLENQKWTKLGISRANFPCLVSPIRSDRDLFSKKVIADNLSEHAANGNKKDPPAQLPGSRQNIHHPEGGSIFKPDEWLARLPVPLDEHLEVDVIKLFRKAHDDIHWHHFPWQWPCAHSGGLDHAALDVWMGTTRWGTDFQFSIDRNFDPRRFQLREMPPQEKTGESFAGALLKSQV